MNTLQKFVSANDLNHNKLMQGILFSILTHNQKGHPPPGLREQLFQTLCSLVRDNYQCICGTISQLICESYDHLLFSVVEQIIWVVD